MRSRSPRSPRGAHELIMDRSSVKWFRIDSKVHHSGAQPKRAQRPYPLPPRSEMHSSNVYVSEYNEQTVPLGVDEENDDSDGEYPVHVSLAKHGCTNDVRLWLETAEQTPTDRSLLQRKLAEADLQPGLCREDREGKTQRRGRGEKEAAPREPQAREAHEHAPRGDAHRLCPGGAEGRISAGLGDGRRAVRRGPPRCVLPRLAPICRSVVQ